jgi:hypothetical protein
MSGGDIEEVGKRKESSPMIENRLLFARSGRAGHTEFRILLK